MNNDTNLPTQPSWLKEGETLRCLTTADRPLHEAMSKVIYEALPSKELLIPMTQEEYDDTYTDINEDVVYGVLRNRELIATSSLLHDVRTYAVNPELNDILSHPCIEIGEFMVLPAYRGRHLMLHLKNSSRQKPNVRVYVICLPQPIPTIRQATILSVSWATPS